MDEECIHGLFPASSCTMCNGKDAQRQREEEADKYIVFRAKYQGVCKECNQNVDVGDACVFNVISRNIRHLRCGKYLLKR